MPSSLFATTPRTTTISNEAGGAAYALSDEIALAQYAATGTFNNTFYATGEEQLEKVKELASKVSAEWLTKVAIYTAERGTMRDVPAFLLAILSTRARPELFRAAARRILRPGNGRIVRTFVQMMRSGQAGRKSLGSAPKAAVREWIESTSDEALLSASVGEKPSLADIIKMVHPVPHSFARGVFYRFLIGKDSLIENLPVEVQRYATFLYDHEGPLPTVRFELQTGLARNEEDWKDIAAHASWNQLRQNINTFQRHGVFTDRSMTIRLAQKLANREDILRAHAMPYALLSAYTYAGQETPPAIREALVEAFNISIENVPAIRGKSAICVDLSGSMDSAVTGQRQGSTSKVQCRDAAALIAVSLARKAEDCDVIGFTGEAKFITGMTGNVLEVSQKLSRAMTGGTDCAAPLRLLAGEDTIPDLIVMVSDNESWFGNQWPRGSSATTQAWNVLKQRNPRAKLVCIDLQPSATAQVEDSKDVYNVGGFSDTVYDIIRAVAEGEMDDAHWHRAIDSVAII